ncbi:MAG: chromosomal replication initiator protein DnaA, partial [Candidatus Roizmanbacteria bacterium]|nr:chromosomal replication initiator protein DnaA [Candidatus Roizmanbacteria bacterium]
PIAICCEDVYYLWISYPHFIHGSMLQSTWKGFLEFYGGHSTKNSVLLSLLNQTVLHEVTDSKVVIITDSQGMSSFFVGKKTDIELALSAYFKKSMHVEFIIKQRTKRKEEPLLTYEPPIEDLFGRAGLNSKYTFENFAVSSSNNVAFAAAQAVSQDPGRSYNPLFFYGGVGVGKTHLAQAAARTVLERNQESKILFCPGDKFTNELIESIQNKTTQQFRKKYRYLHILIVDDIQFIAGKQTIQEEFFHTFNSIVGAGGQVILTSDRPPHEIKNLEDRLRSRFSGGLIVDLQSPDFELRTAILLIKAKEKNIKIQMEAAKVVAEQISDTRALEGTLLSLYARILGKKEEIDLEEIDLYFQGTTDKKMKRVSPQDVIHAVCSYYGIKPTVIKSAIRSDAIAFPRQIIMYILRKELHMKYEEIALTLRRKDHTTIMYAYEKINGMCMKDPSLSEQIGRIVHSLS